MVNCKQVIGTVAYMGGIFAVPELFCHSWGQLIQYNYDFLLQPGEQIWYTKAISSNHSKARNELAKDMKGEWILMLDCDHRFDPDILLQMLRTIALCDFPVDVLSGLYQYKYPPYLPAAYVYNKKKRRDQILAYWEEGAKLLNIDSAGAGILLVKKSVFDRIRKELKQEPFDIIPGYGEDISFFKKCAKLGIKAYLAPEIESNHLRMKPVTLEDRDLTRFAEFDKHS